MHRFLATIALGTALLAGGGLVGSASARTAGDHGTPPVYGRPAMVTSVHDEYYRPRHEPPPRYWHRPAPRWHDHSWHGHHDDYRYGWRQ